MTKEYYLSDVIKDTVLSNTILSYAASGAAAKQLDALKDGQIHYDAELNLSGLKVEPARNALIYFIQKQIRENHGCLLIIHGNDGPRNTPPLLKNLINCWLPQFKEVQAFHSAQVKDGGLGAVYVLLKKRSIELQERLPPGKSSDSFLIAETKSMERKRRLMEQDGERRLARVNALDRPDEDRPGNGPEEAEQNGMLQHPELNSQRFDGIDPNLNPEPPLNSAARREFDNERRNQEQEKQLRLGNMPKFSSTPTPRGPQ